MNCKKCDAVITRKNKSGYCRSCGMLGNQRTLGWKMPEGQRLELVKTRLGKNNPNWKGDRVGLSALHGYMKVRLTKPGSCDNCNNSKPLDLANKGVYNREPSNWNWLCRRCHMQSDGRLNNLMKGKQKYGKNKNTPVGQVI